jgi:hypothetical protein
MACAMGCILPPLARLGPGTPPSVGPSFVLLGLRNLAPWAAFCRRCAARPGTPPLRRPHPKGAHEAGVREIILGDANSGNNFQKVFSGNPKEDA